MLLYVVGCAFFIATVIVVRRFVISLGSEVDDDDGNSTIYSKAETLEPVEKSIELDGNGADAKKTKWNRRVSRHGVDALILISVLPVQSLSSSVADRHISPAGEEVRMLN